jgi:hypothetical protein
MQLRHGFSVRNNKNGEDGSQLCAIAHINAHPPLVAKLTDADSKDTRRM